jgi:hypothetical protein
VGDTTLGGFVMHRGPLSYREFAERVKSDVRERTQAVSDPEGDIAPVSYYHVPLPGEVEASRLFRIDLGYTWFQSRSTKDELVARMAMAMRALRAKKFAWSTTQYMSEHRTDQMTPEQLETLEREFLPEGYVQPSEDPNRLEFVALYIYDAERAEVWRSFIERSPGRAPRFSAWNEHPERGPLPADPQLGGKMHHPLQEALR